MRSSQPIRSRSQTDTYHQESNLFNQRPTHKLFINPRTNPSIKSTTSLIIHRNQIQSSSSATSNQIGSIKEIDPSIKSDHQQNETVSVCIRLRALPDSALSDIDLDPPPPSNRFQSSSSVHSNQFGPWLINPILSQISLSPSHPIIDKRGTGTSEAINGSEGYEFTLDSIYNPYSTTQDLYDGNVKRVIQSCVRDAYNVTVFAYGQTGSGKTFTMMGSNSNQEEEDDDDQNKGIIPKSIDEVFKVITQEDQTREYLLRVSYLEIYNETLKDLLLDHGSTPQKLTIHENLKGRVYVNGLREEVVTDPLQVINTLQKGERSRHVGATDWNERSSRSHTVFTMTIESRPKDPEESNQTGIQISQLNLIDLAGSESAASSIERRKEGSFINKSLLSLSNVISKLAKSEPHVPYRDSKLTRLLSTSLGGNAKVVVICTVSVNNDSVAETLSTLRFARRAKMVVTKAERGTIRDDKSALLQSYRQEIMSLKAQLLNNSQALSLSDLGSSNNNDHHDSLIKVEKSKVQSDVAELQLERIRLQEQIEHLNRRILTRHTIQSNVRRSSLSISKVNPIIEPESPSSNLVRRQRRGRLTDFGGLVSHGGNLGGGIFNVGLRASLLPNMLSVSKEIELEKQISKLKIENQEKENQLKSFKEREHEGFNLNANQHGGLKDELEKLKKEIQRVEDEKVNSLKALEDEIKFKNEEIQKYQVEQVSKTEESQTKSVTESEVENLRTELLNAQTRILELKEIQEKQRYFEKEHREIEIKLNRVEKKYSNERNKAQEIQFELMQITQSRDELENELKKRLAESKGFEQELVEVKESFEKEKQRKEEIEFMKHENKALKDEVGSLKALVEGKDETLMNEKIKLEEEVKNLNQLNEERKKSENRLERELIKLKDLLGEKEMVMSKEKERVCLDLVEIRKTVEEKDREKKVLEVEIEQLRETVLKQENGMVEERKKFEEEGEELRRLMQEGEEKVKLEKERFEKELQELQELMNEKESERSQLEDQVKGLKGLADGQSSVVVEENQRLDKEIKDLKHLLEESMSEKTKLKERLERTESYQTESEDLSSKLRASELKLRKTQDEVKVIEELVMKLGKENEEANRTGQLQNREIERLGKELSEVNQMKEEIQIKLETKSLETQAELKKVHQHEIQKLELQQSNLFNQIIQLEKEIKQEKEKKSDLGSGSGLIESKKKIKELERMIKEQQQENEGLIQELQRSQLSNKSNRHENAHHQAEDEIERLNLIIEEQKKMLSDAKSDMAKWQGHLKAQQAIISKIQGNHHTNPEHLIANLPRSSSSMSSTMNRTVSKSSAPPMSTPTTTPLLGNSMSYSNHSRNSPRPLPVPDSFEDHDEEWRRRKNRRKTIEEDMAKLRDENVVEKKKNVLMSSSPRIPNSNKPKRNLSGLSSRVHRLNNNNLNSLDSIHHDHPIPPLPNSNKSLNDRFKK